MADVFIVGCWFMMREIEMAGALRHHLTLEGNEVRMLIPVHKTSTSMSLQDTGAQTVPMACS